MNWLLVVAAAVGSLFAFRRTGARSVAILGGTKPPGTPAAVNVVWDGSSWRPTGSADTAAVLGWFAVQLGGPATATVNGSPTTFNGTGFIPT